MGAYPTATRRRRHPAETPLVAATPNQLKILGLPPSPRSPRSYVPRAAPLLAAPRPPPPYSLTAPTEPVWPERRESPILAIPPILAHFLPLRNEQAWALAPRPRLTRDTLSRRPIPSPLPSVGYYRAYTSIVWRSIACLARMWHRICHFKDRMVSHSTRASGDYVPSV